MVVQSNFGGRLPNIPSVLTFERETKMWLHDNRLAENFNGQLLFATCLMMLSQINFGMDLAAFSNTQAMDAFTEKFGSLNPKTGKYHIDPYFLSLLNSLTYIGQVFGVVTGGFINRRYGRRPAFFVMTGWAILAAVLLVSAQHKEQILAGRIVNYIYLGQELVTIPVMQAEIVPPKIRGMVVGTYQLGVMIGAFIMASITYGTAKIDGEASFRIPLGLFFIIPLIVGGCAFFLSESPRWLLVRDRHEEALTALRRYRRGKFTEEEITAEYHEQIAMIKAMTNEKGTFKEMWQGINLKRSFIVLGSNICIQISGQGLSSKYGTIFIKDIHGPDPFQMFLINTGIQIAVVLVAMYLLDKTGRKPLLIIGSFVQTATMFIMGGLGTISEPSKGIKIGITAMLSLNYFGFVFGWAPIYHIISAEIPNSRMRDMTYTVCSIATVATQFVVSFSIPYLLYAPYANLGTKIGLVFGPIAFCTLLFAIFVIPECRSFSLEEIDHLFRERVPLLKFQKYKHGHILPDEVVHVSMQKLGEGPSVEERENVAP
ncbi:uncharacterized protein A1O9_02103 [Exophiala aquamarina CBS 119918]|uniref:Major facilitator superfamily (MFS) profile domain-containing protein n=1 Tax=Exophiala aquamarina CBS 119918 TaxID=1182545 RepID=A0A072PLA4_9EURO|nr:uncharacterized protein A1O9_02103 [Exophiala aquamarina CBS 119918]KEF60542.1 hypothetical protein A1O9_02103 [Exophiala aquamarina CBS 119918]